MPTLDLYTFAISPPCRAVISTAQILGVDFNEKHLELFKGEHLTEDFLKLNPHHKVPLLVDEDYTLGESRAIQIYLFNKYAKPESDYLYPKDIQKRGKVDWLLYFDSATLFPNALAFFKAYKFQGRKPNEEETKTLIDTLDLVDKNYFQNSDFLFGDKPSLADISFAASLSFLDMINFDFSKWERISKFLSASRNTAWFKKGPALYNEMSEEWRNSIKEKGLI
ncbi:DgyrCDS6435 [Dimorphilus gyrociliatus]|uniref:DgyrCDS6435 n=1 Tax=Dimorphilus gyrociliatus TaxID=2664684 RepID=A0A7I8VST8_9ANNE|nr:DgyrCDS6435 [Dimorphilus gyrociliatus]